MPEDEDAAGEGAAKELSDTARWDILHHLEEVRAWNRISYEADARIAATGIAVASVVLALTVDYGAEMDPHRTTVWATVGSSAVLVLSVICGILNLRQNKHRIDLRAKIYDGDFYQAKARRGANDKTDHDPQSWPKTRNNLNRSLDAKHFRWDWAQYGFLLVGIVTLVAASAIAAWRILPS